MFIKNWSSSTVFKRTTHNALKGKRCGLGEDHVANLRFELGVQISAAETELSLLTVQLSYVDASGMNCMCCLSTEIFVWRGSPVTVLFAKSNHMRRP